MTGQRDLRAERAELDELVRLVAEHRVMAVRIEGLGRRDPERERLRPELEGIARRIRFFPFG